MYYFCTYLDQNYLSRGLALYYSLREHCTDFKLWVLCMDTAAYQALQQLSLQGIEPIALADFERGDEALLAAKQTRSVIEYYFTCTPSLPLYILHNFSEVDLITYLDADLYFFADPAPLFEEMRNGSIAIIEHRFPEDLRRLEQSGIYNVGWLSFRRNDHALACLRWWREQCIDWCYDRHEDGKFGDQKYLDDWPRRFTGVVVLQHKGANVAPWNIRTYSISIHHKDIFIDEQSLIFFHFHGLKKINRWLYQTGWHLYSNKPSWILRYWIYTPYLTQLLNLNHQLTTTLNTPITLSSHRYKHQLSLPADFTGKIMYLIMWLRTILSITKKFIAGNMIICINRFVI